MTIEDRTDELAALAIQGPLSRAVLEAAAQTSLGGPVATSAGGAAHRAGRGSTSAGPVTPATSATSSGSHARMPRPCGMPSSRLAAAFALRPVGILALDVARVEAGLIMAEVDYTSAWHALTPGQTYSPFELGLGRLVAPAQGGPLRGAHGPAGRAGARRTTAAPRRPRPGLGWPRADARAPRALSCPVAAGLARPDPRLRRRPPGGPSHERHVEPDPQENLALATVAAAFAAPGTALEMEWSVEGERGRIGARVVELPFFDPPAQAGLRRAREEPLRPAAARSAGRPRRRRGCAPARAPPRADRRPRPGRGRGG